MVYQHNCFRLIAFSRSTHERQQFSLVSHDECKEEYCSVLERVDRIIGKLDPPKRY